MDKKKENGYKERKWILRKKMDKNKENGLKERNG